MTRKHLSTSLSKFDDKSLSKWDEAIFDARERIKALKQSIRTFEELRDSGMPWPETQVSGKSESVVNDPFKRNTRKAGVAEQH
jgi:hypothetical protein